MVKTSGADYGHHKIVCLDEIGDFSITLRCIRNDRSDLDLMTLTSIGIGKDFWSGLRSSQRLKIDIGMTLDEDIVVSRERVKEFKQWLDS